MKKNMKLAFAASIVGLALACVPNAQAACGGVTLPQAHPSSLQLQSGSARLVRAALANQDGDDDRGTASIVGMWHVTFTSHGSGSDLPEGAPVDNALVVWHGDNTEIMNSDRPPQDGDFCMGVWKQTGRFTYKLNHFAWFANAYDPTNPLSWSEIGPEQGPTQIVEEITLSPDGNHYSGTFTLDAYDTSGNPAVHIAGVISGTRITMDTKVPGLL
ncbi:MAG: hypothetical protein ACLPLZ_10890 [Terracidiphilus sp.]